MIGHPTLTARLEAELPPVVLLIGPEGVGKHTLTEHLVGHYEISPINVLRFDRLTVSQGRALIRWAGVRPFTGGRKLVTADISAAGTEALNALLKVIEEPPEYFHFILRSTHRPLDTIVSRSFVGEMGLHRPEEFRQVLIEAGKGEADAYRWMHLGSMADYRQAVTQDQARSQALSFVRSMVTHDELLATKVAEHWSVDSVQALEVWHSEAVSGRPRLFTERELTDGRSVAARVGVCVASMRALRESNVRLAAKAVLPQFAKQGAL